MVSNANGHRKEGIDIPVINHSRCLPADKSALIVDNGDDLQCPSGMR